ncbi:MAG: hypothetical protein ACREN2_07805 [Candidatus Dormibacteria bacterium]
MVTTKRGLLSRRRTLAGVAVAAALVATALPLGVHAATGSTVTLALGLGGGLSISSMGAYTTATTAASAGTLATPLNSATWSDQTALGLGWNGTLAVTQFIDQGAFAQTVGTTTALSTAASGAYTGTVGAGYIDVTVTQVGDTTGATTLAISYADTEAGTTTPGTATATKGSATTLVHGLTITFATGTAYPQNAVYQSQYGILPTTALALTTSQASVTPQGSTAGGLNDPLFVNNSSTVTAGGPSTYSASPVKFISALLLTGVGSFTVHGGATITWDPNNIWQANYTAGAQYTIAAGP